VNSSMNPFGWDPVNRAVCPRGTAAAPLTIGTWIGMNRWDPPSSRSPSPSCGMTATSTTWVGIFPPFAVTGVAIVAQPTAKTFPIMLKMNLFYTKKEVDFKK